MSSRADGSGAREARGDLETDLWLEANLSSLFFLFLARLLLKVVNSKSDWPVMGEVERPPSLAKDDGRERGRGRLRPPRGAAGALKMADEVLRMVDVLLSDWVVAGVTGGGPVSATASSWFSSNCELPLSTAGGFCLATPSPEAAASGTGAGGATRVLQIEAGASGARVEA